jgi:hypothetical protein
MVKERIPSALLIEDDSDWDVTLKSQLVELAHGTRYLQETDEKNRSQVPTIKTHSPYGDDWDLIWTGHCGVSNHKDVDQRYYVIPNDPTTVPGQLSSWKRRRPNLKPAALKGYFTRYVFEPTGGLCTSGYALSLRGARKLILHQALLGNAAAMDMALRSVCDDRFIGFKCFAPYPALFNAHKAAGPVSKDSDRTNKHGLIRKVAMTRHVAFSTILNLPLLVNGETMVKSQWPNLTMVQEIDVKAELPRGHGVFVAKKEYHR